MTWTADNGEYSVVSLPFGLPFMPDEDQRDKMGAQLRQIACLDLSKRYNPSDTRLA